MNIFISYAREDQEKALRIYDELCDLSGAKPWIDLYNILPGADWAREITLALRNSDIILLLVSTHSVDKTGYVQKEVREALELSEMRVQGDIFLIPVRLEFCMPKFLELQKLNWVDLFDDWDLGVSRIRNVIQRSLPAEKDILVAEFSEAKNRLIDYQSHMDENAIAILSTLPSDLVENLGWFSDWLLTHDWVLPPMDYDSCRTGIPNWGKQAETEWLGILYKLEVIDSADPVAAYFTDLGLHLIGVAHSYSGVRR